MGGDHELRVPLNGLPLEVIENLALQVDVKVSIRFVEQNGGRVIAVHESQQGERLVKTAASSYNVILLAVLAILDCDVDILGRLVRRLTNSDREPPLDNVRQFLPIGRMLIPLVDAPIWLTGWWRAHPQQQVAEHAARLSFSDLLANWGDIQPFFCRFQA